MEEVIENIEEMAEENGYILSKNVDKIALAKLRFFGLENWDKCPCVRDDEHYCISPRCREHIEKTGKCHCGLYEKGR